LQTLQLHQHNYMLVNKDEIDTRNKGLYSSPVGRIGQTRHDNTLTGHHTYLLMLYSAWRIRKR
jgi:hypothetical protein